jgi:CRP-like cAMP-binding protein
MFAIDLNHPDVTALTSHVKVVRYKKGEVIVRPDDDTGHLHIVINGMVKAYRINNRGEETISVMYGPDNIFPLAWIITQEQLPNFFGAITDCEVALLPREVFVKYMKSSIDVSNAILEKILEQFILFGSRITNLEFKFARERLAFQLLMLAGKFGERKGDTLVMPHISQQDLGATINVSREGVSREIARLERLGVITSTTSSIIIKDPSRLQKEVSGDVPIPFFTDSRENR